MTVGERIIQILEEKGLTQKEFSRLTGIPKSTISTWKVRKQNPGMDKLGIICDVLNVDPYYLTTGVDMKGSEAVDYIMVYNEDEKELVIEYRALNRGQKTRLLEYLRALKKM